MKHILMGTLVFLLLLVASVARYQRNNDLTAPRRGAVADAAEAARPEPPADAKPGDTWTNPTDGSVLVWIPGGEFQMGSPEGRGFPDERPQHRVTVAGFWLGKTEVTKAQWKKFVEAKPEWGKDRIKAEYHNGYYLAYWDGNTPPAGEENHPVVYVSWYAAVAYCEWAGCRLPTEASGNTRPRAGRAMNMGRRRGS